MTKALAYKAGFVGGFVVPSGVVYIKLAQWEKAELRMKAMVKMLKG